MLLNNNTMNTTPSEYNVYSGEGVFSSYRLAYGVAQKNYFIYNHLGSKAVEVDSAGNIIDYVQYSPFGEPLKKNNYQPQCNECLGFIDKEKDRESKLGDHGVRKYDYEIGRITSVDPLWEKYTGWTGYQYSLNNPVNASDGNGKLIFETKSLDKDQFRSTMNVILKTDIGKSIFLNLLFSKIPIDIIDDENSVQSNVTPIFNKNNELIKVKLNIDFKNGFLSERYNDRDNVNNEAALLMEELKHTFDFITSKNPYQTFKNWESQKNKYKNDYDKIDMEKDADDAVKDMNKELRKK